MFDRVDVEQVEAAREDIGDEAADRALALLGSSPDSDVWRWLFQVLGLVAGVSLVVAGVIYIVAFNWAGLGPFSKLAVAATPFAVASLVGARRSDFVGEVAMSAAGFLVGPLLVVYSQQYQTGADPWTLFASWTGLAMPWALLSRTSGAWLGIWVLSMVTMGTLTTQTFRWTDGSAHAILWSTVLWAILWELKQPPRVYPRVLGAFAFVLLAGTSSIAVFDGMSLLFPVFLVLLSVVAQPVYLRLRPDLVMVGLSATAFTWLVGTIAFRLVTEIDTDELFLAFIMMFVWTVIGTLLVVYLRVAMGLLRA